MTLVAEHWDKLQSYVIEADATARTIVDAGPGTGKTAVACGRIASLISQDGISASRILMISFTRTAVAEIRARLFAYVGDDAFSVKLATVDSHAWAIHSGFDPGAKLTGSYESNINSVLALVKGDRDVAEYLEGLEHVIIDEAQDLVGVRSELVEAMIRGLGPDCGMTIFADEAQAIFGFSEDGQVKRDSREPTLLERLRSDTSLRFASATLETIHRTNSPGLQKIFREVRKSVLQTTRTSDPVFAATRDSIFELADEQGVKATDLGLDALEAGSLVLFRTRAEALQTSQFFPLPHSLRLAGYGASLPAWLAVCFFDFKSAVLSEDMFLKLWSDRIEGQCHADYGPSDAWQKLLALGRQADGSVNMRQLRQQLSRSRPPLEIATTEFGLRGPIIGTVHASKGREAPHVTLLVPRTDNFTEKTDEAEETRILFVGATRARSHLRVGTAMMYSGSKAASGRAFRKASGHAMVEIGRETDLSPEGLVGRALMSEAKCRIAQKRLATIGGTMIPLLLEQDAERNWQYQVKEPEASHPLALLSRSFTDDLWKIGESLSAEGGKRRPNRTIRNARTIGARTIVLAEDSPNLSSLNAPWSESGFLLAPNIAAFTMVYFGAHGNGN